VIAKAAHIKKCGVGTSVVPIQSGIGNKTATAAPLAKAEEDWIRKKGGRRWSGTFSAPYSHR
jgi:hypothetical protein